MVLQTMYQVIRSTNTDFIRWCREKANLRILTKHWLWLFLLSCQINPDLKGGRCGVIVWSCPVHSLLNRWVRQLMIYWWGALYMYLCSQQSATSFRFLSFFTHPDGDSVVPLKFREKLIPSYNLRLVERTKTTQHFYITLRWDVGHGADLMRRKAGRMLLSAGGEKDAVARAQGLTDDESVKINEAGLAETMIRRLFWGRFIRTGWEWGCRLRMHSFACRSEAVRLNLTWKKTNRSSTSLQKPTVATLCFPPVSLVVESRLCRFLRSRVWRWRSCCCCCRPAEGEMLLEGQWDNCWWRCCRQGQYSDLYRPIEEGRGLHPSL